MAANFTHKGDQELLDHYWNDHDNQWLGILFERYTMLLFGVCMKYLKDEEEAKDAVQQIFLKIITELQRYRVQYFKSWLYMIAKNYCLMKLRDKQGRPAEIHDIHIPDEHDITDKYGHLEKERKLQLLSECLNELNPEQKQCVTLFFLEKRTYQEIGAETGYSLMQVKSYIQNGKRNLKLLLEKKLQTKR